MRVETLLMAHDHYQQAGGEEESFRAEAALLAERGHRVVKYERFNQEIRTRGFAAKLRLFSSTIWAADSHRAVLDLIRRDRPTLAHFQNTFPLISPSVYYACKEAGVPVVQTLRNYRLICSNSLFLRDERICEDCMGKFVPWPGIVHACYRGSRWQSAAVAAMLAYHRTIKTWESQVDLYVALTDFARRKFIEAGLPPEKILVKPNFVEDAGVGSSQGDYVVYLGRLATEKGIGVLLEACEQLPDIPLKLVGDGPLMGLAQGFAAERGSRLEILGALPHADAMNVIKNSAFVVFPSLCYESFGRTIIEAFACGKPVVASRNGTARELVEDRVTGLHFNMNDADDLAAKIRVLWNDRRAMQEMSARAREEYERKYTPARNYELMMGIYAHVLGAAP